MLVPSTRPTEAALAAVADQVAALPALESISDVHVALDAGIDVDKLAPLEAVTVVQPFGTVGQPAFAEVGWTSNVQVGFFKDRGLLYLMGQANQATINRGNQPIFTLPVGYRPAADRVCPTTVFDTNGSAWKAGSLTIFAATGLVAASFTGGGTSGINTKVMLGGICVRL